MQGMIACRDLLWYAAFLKMSSAEKGGPLFQEILSAQHGQCNLRLLSLEIAVSQNMGDQQGPQHAVIRIIRGPNRFS